ncbi:Protein phosphatase 1 regulatory subunit 3E [Choanephora cucurbitarum]|uniref:Protein phosphatase 1 regulatory subunit 3E n=1 Tax=Choanephora cucurbitarum TaxID=101091 RepID=A0A1C7NE90_9FUNG|nr:Protein phosphatase 1 regulatory subunit 3E [Choanephora cucurbitarum]
MTTTTLTSYHLNLNRQKRIVLKRATHQINDPIVIQQKYKPKKQVGFAQELEQVRYFYKTQSPITVKSDPPVMDSSADDYKLTFPNWPTNRRVLYQSNGTIRMETAQLMDGDAEQMLNQHMVIEGRCRAANLSFHKVVTVRYTFDLWRTYQETTGVFRESIASTSNKWDRFVFNIPVEAKQTSQTIYLALRYTVDNQEYWDNNNGANYEMVLSPIVSQTKQESKKIGKRYDFTDSLTAARKPHVSPPPSPLATPEDDNKSFYTPLSAFKLSPNITKTTEPIPIQSPPPFSAEGFQMSYSDFVNKYCFYDSHSPIYSVYSTSPSAVLS